MATKPLKRVLCTLSEECLALIDRIRGHRSRSDWIEEQLWKSPRVRNISLRDRISRPARRKRGRVTDD